MPAAYRNFLLKNNGGSPVPDCFNFKGATKGSDLRYFFGINNDYHTDLLLFLKDSKGRFPARFFPIGKDSGGNVICISVAGDDLGKVYFWDHEREADTQEQALDIAIEVGQKIAEALKRNGLNTSWDGSYLQRVGITGIKWQRRRFPMVVQSKAV